LSLVAEDEIVAGRPLYKLVLYEDVSGGYYPALDNTNTMYLERCDGKVELLKFNDSGSNGIVVEEQRTRLAKALEEDVD
jgi:hypothetical protein